MVVLIAKEESTQNLSFVVRGRDGAKAHDGISGWQVVPGDRRSGGWFHGEVAQGRGGTELVTACKRGRQEGREEKGNGEVGGGQSCTNTAVDGRK